MIAIQGPEARAHAQRLFDPAQASIIAALQRFECVDINDYFFARTGYTGEDGLEIMVPDDMAAPLWQRFQEAGIQACGLGARDTLRLEAGMLLSGQDMDEKTTPLESGLGWTVRWSADERNFIGMGALLSQQQQGITHQLVGLITTKGASMRSGQTVTVEGVTVGHITSGSHSPTLGHPIALARIRKPTPSAVMVDVRGKLVQATITKPRFVINTQQGPCHD